MKGIRRIAPALAILLTGIVLVQSVDLIWCTDEVLDRGIVGSSTAELVVGMTKALETDSSHPPAFQDALLELGLEESLPLQGERSNQIADCLCHVAFAPTANVPDLGPPAEFDFHYRTQRGSAGERDIAPKGPVPLA